MPFGTRHSRGSHARDDDTMKGHLGDPSGSPAAVLRPAIGAAMEERFNRGRHLQQQDRDANAAEAQAVRRQDLLADVGQLRIDTLNAGRDDTPYVNPVACRLSAAVEAAAQSGRESELAARRRGQAEVSARGLAEVAEAEAAARADRERARAAATQAADALEATVAQEAAARVRLGMPARIAAGATTAARQRLSHSAFRGTWMVVPTHFGASIARWFGCGCGQEEQDSWCANYRGPRPLEDAASSSAQMGRQVQETQAVAGRLYRGMPAEVAAGYTLQRRKWLSHTHNACAGLPSCGNRGNQECRGQFVFDEHQQMESWSCCGAAGRDNWCGKYEGPRL